MSSSQSIGSAIPCDSVHTLRTHAVNAPESIDEQGSHLSVSVEHEMDKHSTATRTWMRAHEFFIYLISSFTYYEALEAATTDFEIDEVAGDLKSEWTTVGRWLLALAAMNISLFTIDTPSLFEVDDFAKNAIAISATATGLGILCDAWFLLQFYHLERRRFMERAHDVIINESCLLFSLSASLPRLTLLLSLSSLLVFGGRIIYNTLPPLVIVFGVFFAGVVMGLRVIVCGAVGAYAIMSKAAHARWGGLPREWVSRNTTVSFLSVLWRRREHASGNVDSLPV